jgi:UDP-3-O-[3-hydroxymyristoyl] N-acetylglucosamine deacetylase
VDYHIDFAHPLIGGQRLSFELTPEAFAREIAKARTFGFLKDVEMLQKNGMALGGSLDNAVVLDDYSLVNPGGLRFADEFVRHKILDFIGDMALMELPLFARFTVHCAGHALHNRFLRELSARRQTHLEEMVLAPAAESAEHAQEVPGEPVAAPAPA